MVASPPPRLPLHLLIIAASEEAAGRLLPVVARADRILRIDTADELRSLQR